ncbi:hypothetical protein BB558_007666 [Smittium angustum]|uniref:XPG N-terminal domain-containing protein n=1 Tax=Smittium angustum TaxID=133377 RepID=A0A2U1IUG7_SMIAN|nr:hypothetical protein BB558_007666 [Smittium angustum]
MTSQSLESFLLSKQLRRTDNTSELSKTRIGIDGTYWISRIFKKLQSISPEKLAQKTDIQLFREYMLKDVELFRQVLSSLNAF